MRIDKLSVDETTLGYFKQFGRVEVYSNIELSDSEILAYIEREQGFRPQQPLTHLYLNCVDDDVEIRADYLVRPFERIRRITGYLVGTLDRFNDAKLAEVKERAKHSIN